MAQQAGGILVFGRTGQLASALAARASAAPAPLTMLGREAADLRDRGALRRIIAGRPWRAVINVAAYNAVDRAEDEAIEAHAVNADAPAAMAEACRAAGIPLLHVSTNYVFDGRGAAPYREDDPPAPQTAYGRSKLAGEDAVRAACPEHVILRTSWMFGTVGSNFPRIVLAAARQRPILEMVQDQFGDPTPASDLAGALLATAAALLSGRRDAFGTYHYSGAPGVSRIDFARAVLDAAVAAGFAPRPRLVPVPMAQFPARARRPINSMLDCAKIARVFGLARPQWRAALPETVGAYLYEAA
ncbi:MAG: dTDP-4-dehydrorhamnose reductase [Rhodospirillaceae bacterium]|nr:dTDP-4-dehydrorhamnose reductase [Rhodospirillaceae bacterium]